TSKLSNLKQSMIPIEPATRSFHLKIKENAHHMTWSIQCCQFPITPAYAFTDYRSQGQTLPCVIIDITTPLSGTLNLFNLYIAQSRSHSRLQICLLHDFDNNVFQKTHCHELLMEDDWLEE
ncbi:hypothetical protein EDD16DRAFT_1461021, partial [Pisolithus croceorrhizus]